MEKTILIKIHENYRKIIAVCDQGLLGKKFEEGKLQLEVNEKFYGGKEYEKKKALKILRNALSDDACFNFVGENSIDLGVEAGLIKKENQIMIQGVPHAIAVL
jgi:uncharacterized protein